MLIGQHYFIFELDKRDEPLVADDPSDYLHTTSGNLIGLDDDNRRCIAGRFELHHVNICAAIDNGQAVFDIFDCQQSTVDYYTAIFSPGTADFSEALSSLLDDEPLWGNVLILERLEILPRFRGEGLGLLAMRRMIERFGVGAAVVAIKPFPLQHESAGGDTDQWEARMKLSELEKNATRATAALKRYYKRLGFRTMKGTPYMFLSTATTLPLACDLVDKKPDRRLKGDEG